MEYQIMEYQKKHKVITPPCRFHWTDEHIKLERNSNKKTRKKSIQNARWSKMNCDEREKETFTKYEVWDNYIKELAEFNKYNIK